MKINIVVVFLLLSFCTIKAQVSILKGSNGSNSTLEVGNSISTLADGIIAPQLTKAEMITKDPVYTVNQKGAIVYVTNIEPDITSFKTQYVKHVGYYVFDGRMWRWAEEETKFFNLPYFKLPLTSVSNGLTFDIYNEVYLKQLVKSNPALPNNFISSNSLLEATKNKVYTRRELDYVITYYDEEVIKVNNINLDGVINYDVLRLKPGLGSFINIILVVK